MKKLHDENGHSVTAVKVERVANGAMCVHLRCCDTPDTDHTHTIYASHKLSNDEIAAKLQEVAKEVAEQHASMNAVHKFITENFVDEGKDIKHKTTMKLLN